MRKLLRFKLLGLALIGAFGMNAQCGYQTIPFSENFTTWPPSCMNISAGSQTMLNTSGAAEFAYWNWTSGNTGIMSMDSLVISSDARLKFKWSSNLSTFYNDRVTVRIQSLNSTMWDTIWHKAGPALASNDGATNTSPGSFVNEIINLNTSYTGDTISVEFYGYSDWGPDVFVDDVILEPVPACPEPTSLGSSTTTATTAVVNWSPVTAAASYTIIYGAQGFDPAVAGLSTTSTVDSVTLTGLSAASFYDFYVLSSCGVAGVSDTSAVGTFFTSCAAITTPYTQDFDNAASGNTTTPNMPLCWTYNKILGTTSNFTYGYTYNFNANTAPNCFRMYSSSSTNAANDSLWIVSPQVSGMGTTDKMMSFKARKQYTGTFYEGFMWYGTMTNPTDKSTITVMDTFEITNQASYEDFYLLFDAASGYNGTDEYMALGIVKGSSAVSNLIDDVEILDIPACFFPIFLSASNITNNSADVSWTSGGTAFNIEYGPVGFTQGTGVVSTSTTNSISLSGLAGNTTYDFYVQNNCAPNNGVSTWTGPFMFTTLCDPQSGPIFTDFATTPTGNTSNPSPPNCWSYAKSAGHTGYGYTYQFSTPYSLPNHFYMYNSTANTGQWQMLISPKLADITTNDAQVTFYARRNSFGGGLAVVGTMSDPADASTFNPIDTLDNLTSGYQYFDVVIDAASGYNGTDEFVAIAMADEATFSYLYLDDITVQDKPNCFPSMIYSATNVSQTNATLNWNTGGGLSYDIEYGPTGFAQGTGMVVSGILDSSLIVTGLTQNTCYDAYVRDSCGATFSSWFGPFTFCTICDAVSTVSEDFESAGAGSTTNPSEPNCWSYVHQTTDPFATYGYNYNSAFNANSGTHSFYIYRSTSADASNVAGIATPEIDSLTNGTKKLKFSTRIRFSGTYQTPLVIGTMSDPTDVSTIHPMDTLIITSNSYSDYEYYIHPSSGYNGTDKFIFLGSLETASTWTYLLIDDVEVTDVPSCNQPINAGVASTTSSSASIDWSSVSGSCFVMEYGPEGFIQGSGNGTTVNNATSPSSITGLSPNTAYDVYIRDCCDSNSWSSVVNFRTDCTSQLSGTYTVGGTPGPNNYSTLDSLIGILNSCGMSGPVTINLNGGTHDGIFIGEVDGSSATNMVTINGSVAGDSIVAFIGMAVDLDGASNVTLNNLYIEAEGASNSFAVWMHNASNNIHITNNTVVANSSTTSSTVCAIAATNSNSSIFSYGDNATNVTIDGNTIIGGYTGVVLNGSSTTNHNPGVTITNNTFTDQYYYGARIYYMDNVNIEGNSMSAFRNAFNYGMYVYYCDNADVVKNEVYASYGLYYQYVNSNATTSVLNSVENNVMSADRTAFYAYGSRNINVYHNTFSTNGAGTFYYSCYVGGGFGANVSDTISVRNNILSANDGYALYVSTIANVKDIDHNLYYGIGTNLAYDGGALTDLAALQAADTLNNVNSVSGDPSFISTSNLRTIVGTVQNNVGDNTVGVTTDFDGVSRPITGSTVVDMGAFEYDPLTSDLQIESADLLRGECLNANDTIVIDVKNVIGGTLNMATTNIVAEWSVTGPVNSNGTITVSTGTLDTDSTLTMMATTVDMSLPGTYMYEANINLSSYNLSGLNDTLEMQNTIVGEVFVVTPESDTLTSLTDSADLKVVSPYFGLTNFFFSEICQFKTTNGTPTGGWPSYLTADDYIEVTGIAGSDLAGITFEQYNFSGLVRSYTFPANTLLSPNGTCILMTGQSATASQPANFLYDATGTSTTTWSSGTASGHILRDASGNIIDAVGYGGFTFPATSGVTTADWSGAVPSASGTSGITLTGADNNLATDWAVSTSTPQTPNALNVGVSAPLAGSIAGLSWTLNGTVIDTIPEISVNPGSNGIYNYIVTYVHACSTFVDTVPVYVNIPGLCVDITNAASTVDCFEMVVSWTSDASTTGSFLEYGPAGYTPGSGTAKQYVTSPDTITNLMPGTAYDVYLVDSCSGGTTAAVLVQNTTNADPVTGAYTHNQSATTLTFATVDFDATASTGNISTYTWDFGDGNNGTGMTVSNNYANNGTYYTSLVITNACASDTVKDTVEVYGITVEETMVDQTISIYPNPNQGQFRIEFDLEGLKDVNVRVMDGIGREVYNRDAGKVAGSYRENVDISNLAKGVYIVQVISDGHLTSRKITVQ